MAAIGFVVAKIVSPTENVFCLGKKEKYILHNKLEDGREKKFLISKGLQNTMNIVFLESKAYCIYMYIQL